MKKMIKATLPNQVSFQGRVKGKDNLSVPINKYGDAYFCVWAISAIKNSTEKDTIKITEGNDGSKVLEGKMSNIYMNALAQCWKKDGDFIDDFQTKVGRHFKLSIDKNRIIFTYEYPNKEKFEWRFNRIDVDKNDEWTSKVYNLIKLIKEMKENVSSSISRFM